MNLHVIIKAKLPSQRDRDNYDWIYGITRNPEIATMAWGMMMAYAADNPQWTFLQCLDYLREHLKIVKCVTEKKQ